MPAGRVARIRTDDATIEPTLPVSTANKSSARAADGTVANTNVSVMEDVFFQNCHIELFFRATSQEGVAKRYLAMQR
jgi:hypothetical protein